LTELKSRRDNVEEWIRYARKYKMKCKILEMQLRKEKQKNESITEENQEAQETMEPEDLDNEDIFHCEEDIEKVVTSEEHIKIQGVFRCTPCEKIFKNETNFREHMRTKHVYEEQDEYSCENCEFKTDSSQLLNNHMKIVHRSEQNELKCSVCNTQFTEKIQYETHLQIGHIQTDIEESSEEEETSQDVEETSEEEETSQEEALIKCHGTPGRSCKEKFKTKEDLMKHRKLVHPSTKVCRDFPGCTRGNECIFVHPEEMDLDEQ